MADTLIRRTVACTVAAALVLACVGTPASSQETLTDNAGLVSINVPGGSNFNASLPVGVLDVVRNVAGGPPDILDDMDREWYYLGVGTNAGTTIDALGSPSISMPSANQMTISYEDANTRVDVDVMLKGFAVGDFTTKVTKSITVTNKSGSAQNYSLFQYVDWNVGRNVVSEVYSNEPYSDQRIAFSGSLGAGEIVTQTQFKEAKSVHGVAGDPIRVAIPLISQAQQTQFLPGDANDDGAVSGSDLSTLLGNWLQPVPGGNDKGDFNADGTVSGSDLSTLLGNWLQSVSGPDHVEAAVGGAALISGVIEAAADLGDVATVDPAGQQSDGDDLVHASQWNLALGSGDSATINLEQFYTPEPSTIAMFGLGMMLLRRGRTRHAR